VVMDAFEQLAHILQLLALQFLIEEAQAWLHDLCLATFKVASKTNRFGYKHTDQFLLDILAMKNEIEWLLKHVFFSGLDKANHKAYLITSFGKIKWQKLCSCFSSYYMEITY
jgi:hypothetical protein